MRALVVDPSRAVRALLGRTLRELGFTVLEADHGRHGLDVLREHHATAPFELALVDGNLPEMDGYEFLRAVRAREAYKDVRLVMVSADTGISQIERALEAGANEYVMKPFTKEVIVEKLAILGLVVP